MRRNEAGKRGGGGGRVGGFELATANCRDNFKTKKKASQTVGEL